MVESKIIQRVREILNSNEELREKYITDRGGVKRNLVSQDIKKYDEKLLTSLLNDDLIKKSYTSIIDGTTIFKADEFSEMFLYKGYWEDSYTKFSNKIGLTSSGKFIDESTDVVLDFPYKDTVLKAGMSKEDIEKKDLEPNEPFLNETLAKPEIDELFEPKILVNAKKYDKDGNHKVTEFSEKDNLIVKGNNLIALHSLEKRYAGKIKLIYIDVPFNTKNDSFKYNDNFTRSTWLTFMQNRLQIAKNLLAPDGSIFVHLDENESHYLKVLMDEIFGEDKFINEIIWRYRTYIGQVKDYFPKKHDSIFWYIKNKRPTFKKSNVGNYEDTPDYNRWKKYLNENGEIIYGNHPKTDSRFSAYLRKYKRQYGNPKIGDVIYKNSGYVVDDVWDDIIALDAKNKTERVKEFSGSGQKPEALIQRIISSVTDKNDIVLDFFMGSATTQAVAMKMGRRFIGIEQMDYINSISVPRLQKVIDGEQGGISKAVNWQGGGSFVYVELMEKNQGYLDDISSASNLNELNKVYDRMKENVDFDFRVDLDLFEKKKSTFSFERQQEELRKIIDKNQLYYNEANIDDKNVHDILSDDDYQFNKSFYGKGDDLNA